MAMDKAWETGEFNVNESFVNGLNELLGWCREIGVEVDKIRYLYHGFQVTFVGIEGDAILHRGSIGHLRNYWETMGMPWDEDDVSAHSAFTLVHMIKSYLDGEDWRMWHWNN